MQKQSKCFRQCTECGTASSSPRARRPSSVGAMLKTWTLALAVCAVSPAAAFAQSNPLYIQFTPGSVKGALYKPDTGRAPHVAVLLIHRTGNFLSHIATTELSQRGFLVLAMNPRSDNNEAAVRFEDNALDIKSGIEFLRRQPGIAKVVLLGHSGGGPATSFYQAVAEKGSSFCRGSNKLVECDDSLAGLPRADGLLLVDAHRGVSVNGLRSLNPAVTDEHDPRAIDPTLDPYSPANGYDPKRPHYSDGFKQKYFRAQAARMNRLVDLARAALAAKDDDVFLVVRGEGARLMELDPSVHHSTAKPEKLLKNDGTIVTQVVESVRAVGRGSESLNAAFT